MSDRKQFLAQIKSVDTKQGIVTSLVSVFGNVDAQKDVVLPGAFKRSIQKWKARMAEGSYLPVLYAHKDDPSYIIGKVLAMSETGEGLEVQARYFLDKPKARDAFNAMEEGVLGGSSFAYDVIKAKSNDHGGLDLAELDVVEVGPTIYPANDATRLVGVKSPDTAVIEAKVEPDAELGQAFIATLRDVIGQKAGRTLSARSQQRIRDAITAHEQGIAALTALLDEHSAAEEGKTEEPVEAKVEDPPVKAEARALMAAAFTG